MQPKVIYSVKNMVHLWAFLMFLICGGICAVAQTQEYVVSYAVNGITYYMVPNGTTGIKAQTSFDANTCLWTTNGALDSHHGYALSQTLNNESYYLKIQNSNSQWTLSLTANASDSSAMFTDNSGILYSENAEGSQLFITFDESSSAFACADSSANVARIYAMPTTIQTIPSISVAKDSNFRIDYSLFPLNAYNLVKVTASTNPQVVGVPHDSVKFSHGSAILKAENRIGSTTLTLTAYNIDNSVACSTSLEVKVCEQATMPTLSYNYQEETITFMGSASDTIYYTTNGSMPIVSDYLPHVAGNATISVASIFDGEMIKAINVSADNTKVPSACLQIPIERYQVAVISRYTNDSVIFMNDSLANTTIRYTLNNVPPTYNTGEVITDRVKRFSASNFHHDLTICARVYGNDKFPSMLYRHTVYRYSTPMLTHYTPYSSATNTGSAKIWGDQNAYVYINFDKRDANNQLLNPNPNNPSTYNQKVASGTTINITAPTFKAITSGEDASSTIKFCSKIFSYDTLSTNSIAIYYREGENQYYLAASENGTLRTVNSFDHTCLWSYDVNHKLSVSLKGRSYYLTSDNYATLLLTTNESNAHEWVRDQQKLRDRYPYDGGYSGGYIYFTNGNWALTTDLSEITTSDICYPVMSSVTPSARIVENLDFAIDSIALVHSATPTESINIQWVALDEANEQQEFKANAYLIERTHVYPIARHYYFSDGSGDTNSYYLYNRASYAQYQEIPHTYTDAHVSDVENFSYEWTVEGEGARYFTSIATGDESRYKLSRNNRSVSQPQESTLSVSVTYNGETKTAPSSVRLFAESRESQVQVEDGSILQNDRYYNIANYDNTYRLAVNEEQGITTTTQTSLANIWRIKEINGNEHQYALVSPLKNNTAIVWGKDDSYVLSRDAVSMQKSNDFISSDTVFTMQPYKGGYFTLTPQQMTTGYSLAPYHFEAQEGQSLRFANPTSSWNKQQGPATVTRYIHTDSSAFEQTRWQLTAPQLSLATISMSPEGRVSMSNAMATRLQMNDDIEIRYQIVKTDGSVRGWYTYYNNSQIFLNEGDKLRTVTIVKNGDFDYFRDSDTSDYFVARKVPTPTLNVDLANNEINFTTVSEIAGNPVSVQVYYTMDGATPSTTSILYSAPSDILNNGGDIRYMGYVENYLKSDYGGASYQATLKLKASVADAGDDNYEVSMRVRNGAIDEFVEYEIHYTTDGTQPSMNSPLYVGELYLTGYNHIRAIAFPILSEQGASFYKQSNEEEIFVGHQAYAITYIKGNAVNDTVFMAVTDNGTSLFTAHDLGENGLWYGPKEANASGAIFYNPYRRVYLQYSDDGSTPSLTQNSEEATILLYAQNKLSTTDASYLEFANDSWQFSNTLSAGSVRTLLYPIEITSVEASATSQDVPVASIFDMLQPSVLGEQNSIEHLSMINNWASISTDDTLYFVAGLQGTSTMVKKPAHTLYKIKNSDGSIQQQWGRYNENNEIFDNDSTKYFTTIDTTRVIDNNVTVAWNTNALSRHFRTSVINSDTLRVIRKNTNVSSLEGASFGVTITYANEEPYSLTGTLYAESDATVALNSNQIYHIKNLQSPDTYLSVDGSQQVVLSDAYNRNAMWRLETTHNSVDNGVVYQIRNVANNKILVHNRVDSDFQTDASPLMLLGNGEVEVSDSYNEFLIQSHSDNDYQMIAPYETYSTSALENSAQSSLVAISSANSQLGLAYSNWGSNSSAIQVNRWAIEPCMLVEPTIEMNPDGVVTLSVDANSLAWLNLSANDIKIYYTLDETTPNIEYNANNKPILTEGQVIKVLARTIGETAMASPIADFTAQRSVAPTYVLLDDGRLQIEATEGDTILYCQNKSQLSWNIVGEGYYRYDNPQAINENDVYSACAYRQNYLQSEISQYATTRQLELWLDYTPSDTDQSAIEISLGLTEPALEGSYKIYWTTNDNIDLSNLDPESLPSGLHEYTGTLQGDNIFNPYPAPMNAPSNQQPRNATPENQSANFRAVAVPIANSSVYQPSNEVSQYVMTGTYANGTLSGSGTQGNPYKINNAADLRTVAENTRYRSGYYQVVNDINASGIPTISGTFTGHWDGNYKMITGSTKPLFNVVSGARIYNVMLKNVNVQGNGAIANEAKDGTRIWNCGVLGSTSVVRGSGNVGGICGQLMGTGYVVNCYNYAKIESTSSRAAGIVGYVQYGIQSNTIYTLVYNCMNYGDLKGNTVSPVYGGSKTSNVGESGVNTYNYYYAGINMEGSKVYNCELAAEERFLNRFEFYRGILNSNTDKCGNIIHNSFNRGTGAEAIGKWVLDKSIAPYPIVKKFGKHPSVINRNYASATQWNGSEVDKYKGRKMGSLRVTINRGYYGTNGPSSSSSVTVQIPITDMDTNAFDYNYYKIQMPYYQDYFGYPNEFGRRQSARIVTGWKITSVTGGTAGTFSTNSESGYNFADRNCTQKDLYSVSGKVFAQGGYYNVPEGVTAITIEAYWGRAVYLSDKYYDVTYDANYLASGSIGKRAVTEYRGKKVYHSLKDAIEESYKDASTVYDNAVVLVGNYHEYTGADNEIWNNEDGIKYTIMSADDDKDNEPDWCLFHQHTDRIQVSPIRFDFLWHPGIGMAAKVDGTKRMPNQGIWQPMGHFEITETCVARYTEFEYDHKDKSNNSPLILNGGVFEQFISIQHSSDAIHTSYIQLGGHIWMKMFSPGVHADGSVATKHCPVSVLGGEYESFYLSGMFKPSASVHADSPHMFANGGKFGHYASGGQEQIQGNVVVKADHIIVNEFYGGGVNANKPITGNIDITINNSLVGLYVGGPKFGDMAAGKTVTTSAKGTIFGAYFGAGYGGSSIYKHRTRNNSQLQDYDKGWYNDYQKGQYVDGKGIAVGYSYEYFAWAGGANNSQVGRFYVDYASLSKANTNSVTNTLVDCRVKSDFYGAGFVGVSNGLVTSTLTNTIVDSSAYGAGYSASVPTCKVYDILTKYPTYDGNAGVYDLPPLPEPKIYKWTYPKPSNQTLNTSQLLIYTNTPLNDFGKVNGNVLFTIDGTSVIHGSVFGGGNESEVKGNVDLMVTGKTNVKGSVFGGGNKAKVTGNTKVNIGGTR